MPKSLGPYIPDTTFQIGPDTGEPSTAPNTWEKTFAPAPPNEGNIKFIILHFSGVRLPANNRLEVVLGYDTDVFVVPAAGELWTRPINLGTDGLITIRYIVDGDVSGIANLEGYARGESVITTTPVHNQTNPDLFLQASRYAEPTIWETRGACGELNWENVACLLDDTSVEKLTARSACITIMMTQFPGDPLKANACSGALIDEDLILTAGHCFNSPGFISIASGSVTFDFQTDCGGFRPSDYAPRFFKIKRLVRTGFARTADDTRPPLDYTILQIEMPPGGLGLTPLTLRPDLPSVGEPVFTAHHPQGVIKKLGNRHEDPPATVGAVAYYDYGNSIAVHFNADLTSGSSGSSLFDASGDILGVNDWAGNCANKALPAPVILNDMATDPPPARARDVVLVFDRSGSMSLPGSVAGMNKMDQAQAAASLFIQLVQSEAGHRAGLVSFSTSPSLNFPLSTVNAANKETLTGPAPFTGGMIGGLSTGGTTTIGGGLRDGQAQLPTPSPDTNLPHMLLLTDGLENTLPMIAEVQHLLAETKLCVIGFGSEASLNGPLLTRLARDHHGNYTRAGSGLELQKFFVLCFGNIFESGSLLDPENVLPEGQESAEPIPMDVCDEQNMTVVIGWDKSEASLALKLEAPDGTMINASTSGVTAATSMTWSFLKLKLPFNGLGEGRWKVYVYRAGGDVEFPPPAVEVRYFVSTIIKGGAYFRHMTEPAVLYTGDVVNPRVILRDPSGLIYSESKVEVTVTAPAEATGNLLTKSGLDSAMLIDGDRIDPRSCTLIRLENESTGPLIDTTVKTFTLYDDGAHDDGAMEPDGIFANPIADLTRYEGNYTFHVKATYGTHCNTVREATWSTYIAPGIDHDNTDVDTQPAGRLPDGRLRYRVRITPQDRYGNHVGPGRSDAVTVTPQPGSEILGPLKDVGHGVYEIDISWQPGSSLPPGIVLTQPGRPPLALCDVSGSIFPMGKCRKLFFINLFLLLLLLIVILLITIW